MNLKEKLLNIQVELKAEKGQYNGFGKYAYRSCEDILEALKPHLSKEKAIVKIEDKIVLIGDRYYVEATASIFDVESDEFITNTASAREEENKKGMDSAQVTGATSSYARKYALNGLFGIDDNKDADATNKHGKEEVSTNKSNPTKPKPTKVKTILDEVAELCAKAIHEEKKDALMTMLKTYHETGKLADIDPAKLPEVAEKIKAL